MKKSIQLVKLASGAAVKFPFEMKNQFRSNFKSAKWNATEKQWEVGPRSIKRLQNWIDEVNGSGIVEELATRDEREMNDREIKQLRAKLKEISLNIEHKARSLEELEDAKREIAEAKEALKAKREEFAAIKAKRDEVADKVDAERINVQALVEDVVSLDEIEEARREMRKNMKIAKAYASSKYDEAADRLREIRDRLEAAGLECEAINKALSANRNRPDRDYDDLFELIVFEVA